jgi:hypothetical protein
MRELFELLQNLERLAGVLVSGPKPFCWRLALLGMCFRPMTNPTWECVSIVASSLPAAESVCDHFAEPNPQSLGPDLFDKLEISSWRPSFAHNSCP